MVEDQHDLNSDLIRFPDSKSKDAKNKVVIDITQTDMSKSTSQNKFRPGKLRK